MKANLSASLVLTVIVLATAFGRVAPGTVPEARESEAIKKEAPELAADAERSVRVQSGDEVTELSVGDYLVGVLAAEMPASFEPEALKAQTVAARSYLERCIAAKKHENADICTDPACCQAFLSQDELEEHWGEDCGVYTAKLRDAVTATDGQYLGFEGEAALCVFHSSSAGRTEEAGELWGEVPYLVSVDSPETKEQVPDYVSRVTVTELDFRDTVLSAHPEADMTGDPAAWVSDVERNDSGRVSRAVIGGAELSGAELRELFSLRSAAFRIKHAKGSFTFTVTGYGHGVGMSQYGANAMAKDGADYTEILRHYYPGTVLTGGK